LASRIDSSISLWIFTAAIVTVGYLALRLGALIPRAGDLAGYHADHLGEIILTLREVLEGKLQEISFTDFVERGVLSPARFGLSRIPDEEIRVAVLELDPSDQEFRMIYEAGHGVGRKENFRLPMTSLAGHAQKSGQLEWTNDVDKDDRWSRHPKAKKQRAYGSLAAVPILVNDEVVAVLNVLSTKKDAFLRGDLTYIELLGTLIGLGWTIRPAVVGGSRLPIAQELDSPAGNGD
jgi:GAF domain-containing protein